MSRQTLFMSMAAAVALFAGAMTPVRAADPPAAASEKATRKPADADQVFMRKAAGSGAYEVEVAKMASRKAESPEVKQFADMLVQHHSTANDELKALAASKDVELPKDMPADKKNKIASLEKNDGARFDRAFIKEVGVSDHRTDIKLFEDASRSAKDAQVKAWAAKTLPTLKQHLAAAQGIDAKTKKK